MPPRPQDTAAPELLCSSDVAALLGVSRSTLHLWRRVRRDGPPEHCTPGGRPYWFRHEVLAWLRGRAPRS